MDRNSFACTKFWILRLYHYPILFKQEVLRVIELNYIYILIYERCFRIQREKKFADCELKMEGMEQWKNEAKQWLQQGIEYAYQIPPTQLYAAAAVLLLTTLFFLIGNSLSLSLSLCSSVWVILSSLCEVFAFPWCYFCWILDNYRT